MEKTISYTRQEHIITRQARAEEALLSQLDAGDYTPEHPLVQLNPYFFAPLCALVLFHTVTPCEVTVRVLGKEPAGDMVHRFPRETRHVLPVYGLYPGWDNQVEITLENGEKSRLSIPTDPLPDEVPQATSIDTTAAYMGDNVMVLTAAMAATPVAFDYRGDIRWYSTEKLNFDLKRRPNGHLLVGTERFVGMPYYTTGVYEMAFSGKIFKEYRVPGGYHHDHFPMEDGNLLILTQQPEAATVEDCCVLVDKDTGKILKSWDYKKVLPQDKGGSGSQDEHDWFHNNAVWYDKKTNSLTFSGRHQDAIINLDYDTGDLNWIIGDPQGWPEEMQRYFFTPVGEDFEWQYEQHACMVLPDGDIMCLDNGHYRSKDPAHYLKAEDSYTRGVRYRIDTEKMTIRQVWQYGKERGAEFFSCYISNVEYYKDGHYLVHSGGIGTLDGAPCEGIPAQMKQGPDGDRVQLGSITCELVDDRLVYELHVPANCYRAEKLPLYYAGEQAELGAGKVLGSLGVTGEFDTAIPAEETDELVPEHYGARLVEEDDRFTFSATYEKGELVQLLLCGEDGSTHRYFINTAKQSFKAMCVGTFQKADPRDVDKVISKEGLSGRYQVKLVCDDKLYETGVTITA